MSQHFPEILENFYKQLAKRVADGDPDSLKMVAEIAKLTGKGAAVNVNVNQVNNNMQAVNQGRDRGFEAIVRKLEMRDAEQARPIADEAVDAEFEDVPPNGAH